MNPYIFVYGTLMAGIKTEITKVFHSGSLFIGEGQLRGKLFDLGHYPGLVHSEGSNQIVFGHVFELKEPSKMISTLDEYENVGERFGKINEYTRKECPVKIGNQTIKCWVYLYSLSSENLPEIRSGNYLEYLKQNSNYQKFIKTV